MRFSYFCLFSFISSLVLAGDLSSFVQKTYQEMPILSAQFTQKTRVEVLEKTIEEKGTLLLARPNRFLIHYLGKNERKYISDGKTVWVWRPNEKELETYKIDEKFLTREALLFLGGLADLQNAFQVQEEPPSLHLTPRSADSPFKKIDLVIDPKTGYAVEAVLTPKSGNKSRYFFEKIKKVKSVSDKDFRPPVKAFRHAS